jgi:hypothetical protein
LESTASFRLRAAPKTTCSPCLAALRHSDISLMSITAPGRIRFWRVKLRISVPPA